MSSTGEERPSWHRQPLGEVYDRAGGRCHLCGERVLVDDATRDHVVPASQGGDNSHENIRLAHRWCNTARADLDVEEWFALPVRIRKSMIEKHRASQAVAQQELW